MVEKRMGYPICIVQDRYSGSYAKGKWIAIADADKNYDVEDGNPWDDSDVPCSTFWTEVRENPSEHDWVAVGNTPDEALANLLAKGWTL